MARPTIDHRGPDFAELTAAVIAGMKRLCDSSGEVFIYPASGTGAWEAALVNSLSPGDRVLMYETGHFARLWSDLAGKLGFAPQVLPGSWRGGADADAIADALKRDHEQQIKAVCVVHNETSTGCVSRIEDIRAAMDASRHPALLLVDTISSLGSIPYSHDGSGVDVTIGCSQKGLMLPPGLSFNAVSAKARQAARGARTARSYWSWDAVSAANATGGFPYTPSTNLLFGLREALAIFDEQGLPAILDRHARHAAATRAAVAAWGLETVCQTPEHHSPSLTAVFLPEGHSADAFRAAVLRQFNMSLGNGLSRLADRVFRIGHLGDFNDLMLAGTLSGVQMGLALCQIPHRSEGLQAALTHLQSSLS
jgi:alanine-glyoxylate transaminase/serine-glyoxylate transaminase/serine-pyruvate transaminase